MFINSLVFSGIPVIECSNNLVLNPAGMDECYPQRKFMTQVDAYAEGFLSNLLRKATIYKYNKQTDQTIKDFVIIKQEAVCVTFPVYKNAVYKAFEEIENKSYDNPEEVDTVLDYIYKSARSNIALFHGRSDLFLEALIQFTATACHNMYGLNMLEKKGENNEDVSISRGLMQWTGQTGYSKLRSCGHYNQRISNLNLYSYETIRSEFKAFVKCYFEGKKRFESPCSMTLQPYLHTISNMAPEETEAFVEDCEGQIFISIKRLNKLNEDGKKIARRLMYYILINMYTTRFSAVIVASSDN